MKTDLSFLDRAGVAIGSGLVVGALAGAVEHLALHPQLSVRGGQEFLYALGIYSALGAVAGLGLAGVWFLVGAVGGPRGERRLVPLALSCHVALFLLFLGGYRLNRWSGMPNALSGKGLLFNGLLVVAAAGFCIGLAFVLGRVRAEAWARVLGKLRTVSPVLISVPFLVLLWWGGGTVFPGTGSRPGAAPEGGQTSGDRPNVVILLIDALRKDHLSGYGYPRRTSMALDHLMDDSVVFENAFAQSNWTVPSVASLFTGTHPVSHGVLATGNRLPEDLITLAESLEEAGYVCGTFLGNAIMDVGGGFDRGFHYRHPRAKPFWCYHLRTSIEQVAIRFLRGGFFWGGVVLGKVEEWVERNRGRPFFAYVHLMEPHSPYEPPPPYNTLFDPDYDGPPMYEPPLDLAQIDQGFRDWEALEPGRAAISERQRQNMVALYDGEIGHVDSLIEGFLRRLRALGLYEGSLIVVTADHGEEFHEHGGWFHGQSLYDELLRVPLVVKLPGQVGAGTRRHDLVAGVDILPSILSILDIPIPPGVEGTDVLTECTRERADRMIFPERPPFLYSVIEGRWKLVRKDVRGKTDLRLFDLEEDSGELNNVVDRYPEIRDRLAEALAARASQMAGGVGAERIEDLDSYQREQLKALGYIQAEQWSNRSMEQYGSHESRGGENTVLFVRSPSPGSASLFLWFSIALPRLCPSSYR